MNKSLTTFGPDDDPAKLLVPVEDYALRPLPEAFENFSEVVLPLLQDDKTTNVFDVTVFYSRRRGISASLHESLQMHNQHAFDAAKKVPGLLLYFQGHLLTDPARASLSPKLDLDFTPDCMSFCIWESLDLAKAGARLPEHAAAASRVNEWYEGFAIKKLSLATRRVEKAGKKHEEIVFHDQSGTAK